MAVSKYFNHISHPGQQKLAEDLIVQAIQQRGIDIVYVPEQIVENNDLLNEPAHSLFSTNHTIEVYVESATNFNGMGDVWGFGGMDMTDKVTLVISQRRFKEILGAEEMPQEGDLVYVPYIDTIYEVKKLIEDEDYHQWGKNYVFRIICNKFQYGHEDIETSIAELDDVVEQSYDHIPLPTDPDQTHITKPVPGDTKTAVDKGQNPFIEFDPFGDNI